MNFWKHSWTFRQTYLVQLSEAESFERPTFEFLRREMNFCAAMAGDICIKGSCTRVENETLTLVSSICRSSVGQSHHVDGGPELF